MCLKGSDSSSGADNPDKGAGLNSGSENVVAAKITAKSRG